jgi:hypothetical protein
LDTIDDGIDLYMLNTYLQNQPQKCKITDYEFENSSNQNSNHDQAEVIASSCDNTSSTIEDVIAHILFTILIYLSAAIQNNFKISAKL